MKRNPRFIISAWAALAVLSLTSSPLLADDTFRTFTNAKGVAIEAKPLAVSKGKVQIETAKGKRFVIPVATLIESDRTWLKDWAKNNKDKKIQKKVNYRFDISCNRERIKKSKSRDYNATITTETYIYDIKIRNGATSPVDDIVVEYIAFVRDEDGVTKRSACPLIPTHGAHEISSLAQGKTISITSKPIMLHGSVLDANYYGKNFEDSHGGLWVKVFKDGKEIGNFQYAGTAFKDLTWSSAKAQKVRPSR